LDNSAGERRAQQSAASEQRRHRAVSGGAAAEIERQRVGGHVRDPEADERDHPGEHRQPQPRLAGDQP
jgi:hypothetical protein